MPIIEGTIVYTYNQLSYQIIYISDISIIFTIFYLSCQEIFINCMQDTQRDSETAIVNELEMELFEEYPIDLII